MYSNLTLSNLLEEVLIYSILLEEGQMYRSGEGMYRGTAIYRRRYKCPAIFWRRYICTAIYWKKYSIR
jgi:hypothetical protein